MDTFGTLKRLTEANGVSGGEQRAADLALELLKEYAPDAKVDCHGSVVGFIGERDNGKPTLLIDAHIDEIGLVVTYIDEGGFIKAEPCGGIDRRLLPAQAVTVHGKKPIAGVICTLPPHIHKEKETALKADEIRIDAGYSKEELEKTVSPGDRITVDGELARMLNGRVCGKALDDRAGVVALLYALSLIKGRATGVNVAVAFSVQEELGCRGARTTAYNANADFAIAVDVSYGMSPGCDKHKCGKLGGGPMIGVAPTLSREMSDGLVKTALEHGIEYQLEIMSGDTGTDADEIGLVKGGVKTGLVSIPLRYMHTPVETADIADIEATGRLLAEYIKVFEKF